MLITFISPQPRWDRVVWVGAADAEGPYDHLPLCALRVFFPMLIISEKI